MGVPLNGFFGRTSKSNAKSFSSEFTIHSEWCVSSRLRDRSSREWVGGFSVPIPTKLGIGGLNGSVYGNCSSLPERLPNPVV